MTKYLSILHGKKTYLVSAGMVLYGALGLWLGQLSPEAAAVLIFDGLAFAGIRHGVSQSSK